LPTDFTVARARTAAVLLSLGLAASSCTGSSSGAKPTSPPAQSPAPTSPAAQTTPTAPTTPSTADVKAEVRRDYLAYWVEFVGKAGRRPDPKDERIAMYTTGDALKRTKAVWIQRKHYGRGTYGFVVPRIQSISVEGKTATVVDCQDSSKAGLARISDGHKLTVGVKRHLLTTTLVEGPTGTWKVSKSTHVQGSKC